MKNEIIEKNMGKNTQITTLESTFIIPESTIQLITSKTNDREEAIELLSYLKDRVDMYNSEMDTIKSGKELSETKFKYSASFVEKLFVSLLDLGFSPDLIMIALDGFKDSLLFGTKTGVEKEEDARVAYICTLAKTYLCFESDNYTEEDTYSNVDELRYHRG